MIADFSFAFLIKTGELRTLKGKTFLLEAWEAGVSQTAVARGGCEGSSLTEPRCGSGTEMQGRLVSNRSSFYSGRPLRPF